MNFLCLISQSWMQPSRWDLLRADKGEKSPPTACCPHGWDVAQNTFDLLDYKQTLPSHVHLFIHQHPNVLLSRTVPCPFFAQPVSVPQATCNPLGFLMCAWGGGGCCYPCPPHMCLLIHSWARCWLWACLGTPLGFPHLRNPLPQTPQPPLHRGTHLLQNQESWKGIFSLKNKASPHEVQTPVSKHRH